MEHISRKNGYRKNIHSETRKGGSPRASKNARPNRGRSDFPRQFKQQNREDGDSVRVPFSRPYTKTHKTFTGTRGPKTKRLPHPKTQVWRAPEKRIPATESWGQVARWYDKHLATSGTYHEKVLLPNLLRLIDPKKDDVILDVACGQGFFTKKFSDKEATMIGIDAGKELIDIARATAPDATFYIGSADDLSSIADQSIGKAMIVLAMQNMEHIDKMLMEIGRVLRPNGTLHIVMNHPAFRIPKQSSWQYDESKKIQYRRVDGYLSESRAEIEMNPGMRNSAKTLSFHRPLQYYFKSLGKSGFFVDRLEEWISHKESASGPRARAENRARKEIPLFLYLRAQKQ